MRTHLGCVFVDKLVHIHTHKICFLSLIYFCVGKLYVKCNCSQLKGTLCSLGLCGWYNRTHKKTRTTLSNFISRKRSTLIFVFWIHFNKAITEILDSKHSSICLNTFLCQGLVYLYAFVLYCEYIQPTFSWWQNALCVMCVFVFLKI